MPGPPAPLLYPAPPLPPPPPPEFVVPGFPLLRLFGPPLPPPPEPPEPPGLTGGALPLSLPCSTPTCKITT